MALTFFGLVACQYLYFSLVACQYNDVPPEVSAAKFAADLGLQIQGKPNCTGVDTDRDGYVSCTLNIGEGRMKSIQCADITGRGCDGHTPKYATGCKETSPAIQYQQQ
jgi:hypothetical protein